jgi:hypothetical protein
MKGELMLHIHLDTSKLCSTLAALEPVKLKGLDLLQSDQHVFGLLPNPTAIPREILRDAVLELIAYTDTCARAIQRLCDVPPVPLTAFPIVEWAL